MHGCIPAWHGEPLYIEYLHDHCSSLLFSWTTPHTVIFIYISCEVDREKGFCRVGLVNVFEEVEQKIKQKIKINDVEKGKYIFLCPTVWRWVVSADGWRQLCRSTKCSEHPDDGQLHQSSGQRELFRHWSPGPVGWIAKVSQRKKKKNRPSSNFSVSCLSDLGWSCCLDWWWYPSLPLSLYIRGGLFVRMSPPSPTSSSRVHVGHAFFVLLVSRAPCHKITFPRASERSEELF